MTKTKEHSCKFAYAVKAQCICGWESSRFWGKGAQGFAAFDYHDHVNKCNRAKEPGAIAKAMLAAAPAPGKGGEA